MTEGNVARAGVLHIVLTAPPRMAGIRLADAVVYQFSEQNTFYLPNENTKIIKKNRTYKWQATRRANCPSKLAV